jgi:nucleoside-diphosphate-sugar epimerase
MKTVVITGGNGFVGLMLQQGLRQRGWHVDVFDRLRSPMVSLLRRRFFGTATASLPRRAARFIHRWQRRLEPALIEKRIVRPTWDDILDVRERLTARFLGHDAVIHLAGIAHPHAPLTIPDDFQRINYDGSVNVFEAARAAGVPKFIFASSAQVYGINAPVRIDQFPILETNYCPTRADGLHAYGVLKRKFERYMEDACADGSIQGIALRLEYPGSRSYTPTNFYVCTAIENLVSGVAVALEAPATFTAEAFNIADAAIPGDIDIQAFVRERWPDVPNHTTGNSCLLSTEKAQRMLGYKPITAGTYFDPDVV